MEVVPRRRRGLAGDVISLIVLYIAASCATDEWRACVLLATLCVDV